MLAILFVADIFTFKEFEFAVRNILFQTSDSWFIFIDCFTCKI